MKISAVRQRPDAKVSIASARYREEVKILFSRLIDETSRTKRADLITSLQATTWYMGRCDVILDLASSGDLTEEALERFASRLPSNQERMQPRRRGTTPASTLKDVRQLFDSDDITKVVYRWGLVKKLVLFSLGALGSVLLWSLAERFFRW